MLVISLSILFLVQAMLDCISKLKDAIDYLTEENDKKDKQIEK